MDRSKQETENAIAQVVAALGDGLNASRTDDYGIAEFEVKESSILIKMANKRQLVITVRGM